MIVLVIILIIFVVTCFFIGRKIATTSNSYPHKYPVWVKFLLLGYIIFAGCFTFPISSERFPIDFMKVYLLICSYGLIGLGFAGLYGVAKEKFVYLITLCLTVLGIGARYILEYGEVSNTYNFTPLNIIAYVILIPAFTTVAYHYIAKHLSTKN